MFCVFVCLRVCVFCVFVCFVCLCVLCVCVFVCFVCFACLCVCVFVCCVFVCFVLAGRPPWVKDGAHRAMADTERSILLLKWSRRAFFRPMPTKQVIPYIYIYYIFLYPYICIYVYVYMYI